MEADYVENIYIRELLQPQNVGKKVVSSCNELKGGKELVVNNKMKKSREKQMKIRKRINIKIKYKALGRKLFK